MVAKLELVLDCADADRLADFWAAALGYRRLGSAGNYRSLVDPDRISPKLILQEVAEPKTAKNRLHLDLHAADIEAEASRLVGLGATRTRDEPFLEHGTSWILMADPEGNEFCVCELESETARPRWAVGKGGRWWDNPPILVRPPEGFADMNDEEKRHVAGKIAEYTVRKDAEQRARRNEGDDAAAT